MSLDKAIEHGKEKRKEYHGAKAIDHTCRSHGSCPWCQSNRSHKQKKREPLTESAPTIFMDGICPKCGEICGNGGVGDILRCRCGWSGSMDESDTKLIDDFIRRHKERNGEEAPHEH